MQRWSPDGVRQERTGWRCDAISARHRVWGFNCPAVDLDFVMVEYNRGQPVALIEYKERHAREPVIGHPTYRALAMLAEGYIQGPLPFFIAFYDAEDWWFRVLPVNEAARAHYAHCLDERLTEQRFVRSLYLLRKRVLTVADEASIAALNCVLPPPESEAA